MDFTGLSTAVGVVAMDFTGLMSVLSTLSDRQWRVAGYSRRYQNRVLAGDGDVPFSTLRNLLKLPDVREVVLPGLLDVSKTAARRNKYKYRGWVRDLKANYSAAVAEFRSPIEWVQAGQFIEREGLRGTRQYNYVFEAVFAGGEKEHIAVGTDLDLDPDTATEAGYRSLVDLLDKNRDDYQGHDIGTLKEFRLVQKIKFRSVKNRVY